MDEDEVDFEDQDADALAGGVDTADLFGGEISDEEGDDAANPQPIEEEEHSAIPDEQGYHEAEEQQSPEKVARYEGASEDVGRIADFQNENDVDDDDDDDDRVQQPAFMQEEYEEIVESLAIPKISAPGGPSTTTFLAKMPNFLSVEPTPFDKTSFARSLSKADFDDEEKLLRLENTIRWRYKDARSKEKDSNARIVKWSNGTFSLLLGSELFDCNLKPMSKDHHYLGAVHPHERVLEAQTRFSDTIMFIPASKKNSVTHRRMTAAIAKRHQTEQKTKLFAAVNYDPVAARKIVEKQERELARAAKKMKSERQKTMSMYGAGGGTAMRDNRYGSVASSNRRGYYDDSNDEEDDRSNKRGYGNQDQYERDFVQDDEEVDEMEEAEGFSDSENERLRDEKLKASKKAVPVAPLPRNEFEASADNSKKSATKRRIIDSDDDDE
ncbi:hypothetical protein HDU83_002387 [Entophlyctis luteolus]|nr:hypothetical protein HDU83_002387 [Entophlyctis luteolus]